MQSSCVFCSIINGSIPAHIIAQTDDIIVIKDIAPRAPVHYLIIPKKHVSDVSSLEPQDIGIAGELLFMAQKLALQLPGSQAFRLITNNGADAGQKVFHLHFHFISGQIMTDY